MLNIPVQVKHEGFDIQVKVISYTSTIQMF